MVLRVRERFDLGRTLRTVLEEDVRDDVRRFGLARTLRTVLVVDEFVALLCDAGRTFLTVVVEDRRVVTFFFFLEDFVFLADFFFF